jgi:hypothetical protein
MNSENYDAMPTGIIVFDHRLALLCDTYSLEVAGERTVSE